MESDETLEDGTVTLDTSAWPSFGSTISTPGSLFYITNGGTGATSLSNYTTMAPPSYGNGITVEGDSNFKGDLKVNGKSIVDTLAAIEKRLSILTPDPKKLAKYEALQKAYAHYKTIEAMCHDDDE